MAGKQKKHPSPCISHTYIMLNLVKRKQTFQVLGNLIPPLPADEMTGSGRRGEKQSGF